METAGLREEVQWDKLFFYYPSEEYLSFLMMVEELSFYDEIDCSDLFSEEKVRERILIFRIGEE